MRASAALLSVADATRSVADAAELLRVSIDDPEGSAEYAVERLEELANTQIGTLDRVVEQGFEAKETEPERSDSGQDVLAAALAQVSVGGTLVAASEATGESGLPADPAALDRAIDTLRTTTLELEAAHDETEQLAQGFADKPRRSPDLPSAVATLRGQAGTTLEGFARDAAGVVAKAYEAVKGVAPEALTKAIESLGERLELGERMGRLLRLGVRALRQGLDSLARLLPPDALHTAKEQLANLWERLAHREPAPAVLGWIFEVEAAKAFVADQLSRPDLDVGALDGATAALEALSGRFERTMKTATGIVTAVTIAASVLAHLAVAQAAPIVAGAVALVAATIIVLGRDYADAGRVLRLVTGVRETVAHAVHP